MPYASGRLLLFSFKAGNNSTSICASFASFALREISPNLLKRDCDNCQFMLLEASGVFIISAIFDQLMSIFVHVAVPQIDQVSIFADGITVFGNEIDQHPKQSGLSSSSTKFN